MEIDVNIRDIDLNLVNAQECRRFLDRLFGFLVSKELWYNVKGGLSAGRVQSPAVKILVDREKQRTQFVKSEYWSLQGNFKSDNGKIFSRLVSIDNEKIAIGKSFNKETGKLSAQNTIVLDEDKAKELENIMKQSQEKIKSIKAKGVAGGDSVKITLNGEGELENIDLSNDILKEDKTIIEDLIKAAHNNAKTQLKSKTSEEISKATGGIGIPGFKWPL